MKVQNLTIFLILLYGCGKTREIVKEVPVKEPGDPIIIPGDPPPEPPVPAITSFIQAQAVVLTPYCSECHVDDLFIQEEGALQSSEALNLLRSETMPPRAARYPLGDNLREAIVDYISEIQTPEDCEETIVGDSGDDC